MVRIKKFDVADYLDNPETIAEYLNAAFETGDTAFIAKSLGDVARARGMVSVSAATGLGRESLYKALSPGGNPAFDTVQKVIESFGLKFSVEPNKDAA